MAHADLPVPAPVPRGKLSLPSLRATAAHCTACDLYKTGTQTVFGEGLETARAIFLDALAESNIPRAFAKNVQYDGGALRIGDDLYDLSNFGNVLVISFGKAAHAMAESLAAATGSGLTGIIVDPVEHTSQLSGFRYFRGGHPTPEHAGSQGALA